MVVVLVNEFGGDWERMADHFRREIKSNLCRQYAAEALLNHLRLLRQTFDRSGLTVEDVLGEATPALLKRERRRARRAILEIYNAMRRAMESGQPYQTVLDPPPAGPQHLHGKKGTAVVHVGAVDAPVTIDEVNACLAECRAMKQKELHVLGWEWEMGLANLMVEEAKAQGVKLLLLTIPREVMEQQAVEKGDVHFYELAYLETDIQVKGRKAVVKLTDFVIPNDELIPPEVRAKIKKWSDYVDYWAVDWDFRDDTFVNGWSSYRTRRDRTLQLKSDPHEYAAPGRYRILVKVIDIFGNDTSQVFEVKVE